MRPPRDFFKGSPRALRPPGQLRISPIYSFERPSAPPRSKRRAFLRRRPDELSAIEPLGVERHSDAVMPEDFGEIAAAPAEDVEIAHVRVALQLLMPRRMSVWPVAIQTRQPAGMGITIATPSRSR
jgi:hypothetical protein